MYIQIIMIAQMWPVGQHTECCVKWINTVCVQCPAVRVVLH